MEYSLEGLLELLVIKNEISSYQKQEIHDSKKIMKFDSKGLLSSSSNAFRLHGFCPTFSVCRLFHPRIISDLCQYSYQYPWKLLFQLKVWADTILTESSPELSHSEVIWGHSVTSQLTHKTTLAVRLLWDCCELSVSLFERVCH